MYEQLQITEENIEKAGESVKAIISDGNRVNSACFQKYATLPEKPWVTDAGVFLLYDFVQLLKNIRNLWLTEKSAELVFEDKGVMRLLSGLLYKICKLYYYEMESNVKMSYLTEEAVAPKPIERQKVSTCLKVFSERTYHAIVNHSRLNSSKVDTAIFLQIVINWWKILNVKSRNRSVAKNDALCAEIRDPSDSSLGTILTFGDMMFNKAGAQGKRIKQLTKDTATAVRNTCYGLVELCKVLPKTTHEYVLLGHFSTDSLEKDFSKFRQGSGGTYFISVQQVIEKLELNKLQLFCLWMSLLLKWILILATAVIPVNLLYVKKDAKFLRTYLHWKNQFQWTPRNPWYI